MRNSKNNNEHGNTAAGLKYLSRQPTTGELNASSVQLQTKGNKKNRLSLSQGNLEE